MSIDYYGIFCYKFFMFTFNKYKNFPDWLLGQQEKSKHFQTAGKDADIRTGDIMLSHYTKNGTRVDQKHFDNGDNTPWSNSEIAREIIMNALYEAVKKEQGVYNLSLIHI